MPRLLLSVTCRLNTIATPNPALQRTPPASPLAPLSLKTLGDRLAQSAAAIGLVVWLTACASTRSVPSGYDGRLLLRSEVLPALSTGVTSITVRFSVENISSEPISACVGDPWGVNIILQSGREVGPKDLLDHPSCITLFKLAPGERFAWVKEGATGHIEKGLAKVNTWAKIVDPKACDTKYGCYAFSLTTPLQTVALE